MTYTKHVWADGETITDTKLNNIENGIQAIDTEVTDIRTGYDGTEYESAGDAVRGQIENVLDELDSASPVEIYVSGSNLVINTSITNANEVEY